MKKKLNLALVGHTGFVGKNIFSMLEKKNFKISKYNSKNSSSIYKKKYHSLIFAGLPATKWKINLNPKKDIKNIKKILQLLKTIKVDQFILISTIDIYNHKEPYGFNRLNFEKKISKIFNNLIIIRLPALFGPGLKKNIVFDLIHNNYLHAAHSRSILQFYNMKDLWRDIEITLNNQIKLINFNSEPIMIKDIAMNCFNMKFDNIPNSEPVFQNIKTLFAPLFGSKNNYMYQSNEIFKGIKEFVSLEK